MKPQERKTSKWHNRFGSTTTAFVLHALIKRIQRIITIIKTIISLEFHSVNTQQRMTNLDLEHQIRPLAILDFQTFQPFNSDHINILPLDSGIFSRLDLRNFSHINPGN